MGVASLLGPAGEPCLSFPIALWVPRAGGGLWGGVPWVPPPREHGAGVEQSLAKMTPPPPATACPHPATSSTQRDLEHPGEHPAYIGGGGQGRGGGGRL